MSRVIIADDHIVLRQGLRALLEGLGDLDVVAEACDGFEVIPLVEKHSPDVLIIDLSMPNLGGIETITRLRKLQLQTRILVLSARDDDVSVRAVMRAGANGFVPKTAQSSELEFALKAVISGKTYLSPSVCCALMETGIQATDQEQSPFSILTSREREVMKLLSEGRPNRDVAKILHISPRTVDSHRANIMKKIGIKSNAELVGVALKYGLIE